MNLFGQTNVINAPTGDIDSLVVVDIATIREANSKLIERQGLIKIVEVQDTLINYQSKLIKVKDIRLASYQKQIDSLEYDIVIYNEDINKLQKKARNRLISTSILGASTIILILVAL